MPDRTRERRFRLFCPLHLALLAEVNSYNTDVHVLGPPTREETKRQDEVLVRSQESRPKMNRRITSFLCAFCQCSPIAHLHRAIPRTIHQWEVY